MSVWLLPEIGKVNSAGAMRMVRMLGIMQPALLGLGHTQGPGTGSQAGQPQVGEPLALGAEPAQAAQLSTADPQVGPEYLMWRVTPRVCRNTVACR